MATVTVTVDCEAAGKGKCYTRELVKVAEEFMVPLTWLIFVSEKDPMSNVNLYHGEYFHRIPSWHEYGMLLSFENSHGYISDPEERGNVIRIGKDVLKQCHIKATSFRAHRFDLLPADLRYLADIGILVDGSACPGAQDKHEVAWPDGPAQPYRPSAEDLAKPGDAPIWMIPLATYRGVAAYLDFGWAKVEPVIRHAIENSPVVHIALSDYVENTATLRNALTLLKQSGARFATLTQVASEL
ncbi:MAG: hypothetical protein ACP5VE_02855 [Chthonomonadales bacterium]